jgi:hypothetical protein
LVQTRGVDISNRSGWCNESFRGYADYTQTKGFQDGLEVLVEMRRADRTAIMCA